jgi:hypothetical protein
MPRRNKPLDEPLMEPILALPPARHKHEHEVDPYQAPAGAVPTITVKPEKLRRSDKALDRAMTGDEKRSRALAQREAKELGERYDTYIDHLGKCAGDQTEALALTFGLSVEEAYLRRFELHADVCRGMGSSSLGNLLEKHDLGLAARVARYRAHVFSPNPAASLKALQEINEMEGSRSDQGSFESFVRLAKAQGAR